MLDDSFNLYCQGSHADMPDGAAAGYGVFADDAFHSVRIGRPVAGPVQTSQRAVVTAFLAALEVAGAHRVGRTVITVNSAYVARGYNEWLDRWAADDWTKAAGGQALEHADLWEKIHETRDFVRERRVELSVVQSTLLDSPQLETALGLARYGVKQHCPPCTWCGLKLGVPDCAHRCRPTCKECDNRTFVCREALAQHNRDAHSARVNCRRCGATFGSLFSRSNHESMAHNSQIYPCEYCTAFFVDKEDAEEHERTDCDFSPYCQDCDRWFASLRSRAQHMRAKHYYS